MQEYVRAEDVGEVEKGLRALAVPFFHHEFVRQAIVIALHNTPKQDAILSLLGSLAESGFLSTTQLVRVWPSMTVSLYLQKCRNGPYILCNSMLDSATTSPSWL